MSCSLQAKDVHQKNDGICGLAAVAKTKDPESRTRHFFLRKCDTGGRHMMAS